MLPNIFTHLLYNFILFPFTERLYSKSIMSSYGGCHMYNEEDDTIVRPATDVFEINDFTAATEWENFIDDIENVLR